MRRPVSDGMLYAFGLDLGDRSSHYCVLDESGRIVTESKTATSPKAMEAVFGGMTGSRIALETLSDKT
jgi:transposase